jgi:hypothetical protein
MTRLIVSLTARLCPKNRRILRNSVNGAVFGVGLLTAMALAAAGPAVAHAAPPTASGPADAQYVELVARHSGQCLDVTGGSVANGTPVIQWPCHGGANQEWVLVPTGTGHYFATVQHSGQCLDVSGASTMPGTPVIQYPCHGGANQQWDRYDLGNGYSIVVAVHSRQCLDVTGGGTRPGTPVIQWPCHRGNNQQWRIG